MKRFSEQFHKSAQKIALTASEKDVLRERLVAFMEYHPLPTTHQVTAVATEPFKILRIPSHYFTYASLVCVMFVIVGIPVLAERAVPGDILYPMKIRVNEEVLGTFSGSGYEKVAWETERLERRIAEARLLAKEGRLTESRQQEVIAAIEVHQAATEAEIDTLRATDAEGATLAQLALASVLDVQSASLKANDAGSTTEGVSTVLLAQALDEAQMKVKQKSDQQVSYERLLARLEQETTRGRELLASIKSSATEQEYNDLDRRLGDIERKVSQGVTLHDNGTAEEAVASLRGTWRDMQVILTFMTNIDVRSSLALDTFVPVVLTAEEEKVLAITAYNEAVANVLRIEATLPTITDAGITDKVAIALPHIVTLLDTASTSLRTDDVLVAKQAAIEARENTRSFTMLPAFATAVVDGTVTPTPSILDMMATTSSITATSSVASSTETTTPANE